MRTFPCKASSLRPVHGSPPSSIHLISGRLRELCRFDSATVLRSNQVDAPEQSSFCRPPDSQRRSTDPSCDLAGSVGFSCGTRSAVQVGQCESTRPRKHDSTSSGVCSRKRMRPICSRRPARAAVTRCCTRAAPPRSPAGPSSSIPARWPLSALTHREARVLAWRHERHGGTHAAGRAPERLARRVPRRPPP